MLIGLLFFGWIYRGVGLSELKMLFVHLRYQWVVIAIAIGLLSHVIRAYRWNMLIKPMGYDVTFKNAFLAIYVMYLTNLLIPRAGEVARCSMISKYDRIPISKLIATVIIERVSDLITLLIISVAIFVCNIKLTITFLEAHPQISSNVTDILSMRTFMLGAVTLLIASLIIFIFHSVLKFRFSYKLQVLKLKVVNSLSSIAQLSCKCRFIGCSLLIFILPMVSLYFFMLSYEPTSKLAVYSGLFVYIMGMFAMIVPVQGGIGPWHFMIYETLSLYGIDKSSGKMFALLAHSAGILVYLFFGVIALVLFPLLNPKFKSRSL